jgi:hypothetical protein
MSRESHFGLLLKRGLGRLVVGLQSGQAVVLACFSVGGEIHGKISPRSFMRYAF